MFSLFQGSTGNLPLILILLAWTMPWKAVALWKASHRNDKVWFIAIFLVNTLALLEILYIFFFSKPERLTQWRKWFKFKKN